MDYDSGHFPYSRVFFKADESGTYYVAAGAHQDFFEGTYTLSVEEVTDGM